MKKTCFGFYWSNCCIYVSFICKLKRKIHFMVINLSKLWIIFHYLTAKHFTVNQLNCRFYNSFSVASRFKNYMKKHFVVNIFSIVYKSLKERILVFFSIHRLIHRKYLTKIKIIIILTAHFCQFAIFNIYISLYIYLWTIYQAKASNYKCTLQWEA